MSYIKVVYAPYTNWKGQTRMRRFIPQEVFWGKTDFHPEEQWFMKVWDVDKDAERIYALKDLFATDFQDLNRIVADIEHRNRLWWKGTENIPEHYVKTQKLMLMVTELAEATEGIRKDLSDSHLPDYPAEVVEVHDSIIRHLDYLGHFFPDYDHGKIMKEKLDYNANRRDHTLEGRATKHGKKF